MCLFQTPCVFHARPALLGFAIHRSGFELALGQASPGRFIQASKARGLLNGRFKDLAVCADQELELHSAFFFQALGGAWVLGLLATGSADHGSSLHGRCRWWCRWCRRRRHLHRQWRRRCYRLRRVGHSGNGVHGGRRSHLDVHGRHIRRWRWRQILRGRRWGWRRRNIRLGFFQKYGFYRSFDDLHKLPRKPGIDGPKQQPVQHNHRSQPDHMFSGCSLPAGVIYHVVNTLSVTKPLKGGLEHHVVKSEVNGKLL